MCYLQDCERTSLQKPSQTESKAGWKETESQDGEEEEAELSEVEACRDVRKWAQEKWKVSIRLLFPWKSLDR